MAVKHFDVMNLSKTGLLKPDQVSYQDSIDIIRDELHRTRKSFIKIGWYLKHINEAAMYAEDGYENIYEFAHDKFNISQPTTTRFMNLCIEFSVNHNSPELDEKYMNFSVSQLFEMLPMKNEEKEQITPDMTVKQIREKKKEIRRDDQQKDDDIPGQTSLEKDFAEYMPEGHAEKQENEETESYATSHKEKMSSFSAINNDIQKECGTEPEHWEAGKEEYKEADETGNKDDNVIDGEYREIDGIEPKEKTVGLVEISKLVKPDDRQRKYLNAFARYFISCNFDWLSEDFDNRVSDVTKSPEEIKNHLDKNVRHWSFKTDEGKADIELFDNYIQLWDEYSMWVGNFDWFYLAAAIQSMWNVVSLEKAQTKSEQKPELPVLKNNDQRKEWLAGYKEWGLWYRDENIDVNYYKYDFEDGSRLIVAEYPQRQNYYKKNKTEDEHFYHLLQIDKEGYKFKYNEKYRNNTDSETYLIEFLKNLQKKEPAG